MTDIKQDPKPIKQQEKPKRKIVLETDGNNINIAENELTKLEMISVFSILLNKLNAN